MSRANSMWIVARVAMRASGWQGAGFAASERATAGVPLRALRLKKEAVALRDELEQAARQSTPLSYFLWNFAYSDDPAKALAKVCKRAGLPKPDLSAAGDEVTVQHNEYGATVTGDYFGYLDRLRDAMQAWWDNLAPSLTPELNARLWDELFPDHRFYAVQRVPVGD